jgi:ACS family glucarate transporter-like MFS transporter
VAETRIGKVRWVLVVWMFVISAVAYLDRVNISIAGKAIAAEFHLTNVQIGYVFSAFLVGYALFQIPGGRLVDYMGPRRVLAAGVIWWGLFTALTALVPTGLNISLGLFVLVRFLLGSGESVVYPACNRTIAKWIPISERGIANGMIFAGVGFGAGVTPLLVTWIMTHWGWRWSFWMSAIVGLLTGCAWYLMARDDPQQHPWVSEPEKKWITAGLDIPAKKSSLPFRTLITNRNVLVLFLSYFTYGYSAYIFFTWFFLYLVDVRGVNLKTSAFYSMLPFIAMTIGSLVGGFISDFVTRHYGQRIGRSGIAITGMLLAAVFIALGSHARNVQYASLILAGGAGALYLSQSSFWSATADLGGVYAGSVSSIMNMGNQIGGAITASLTPFIANRFGWNTSFGVAAALCVLGAAAWFLVDPQYKLLPSEDVTLATVTTSDRRP